MAKKKKQGKTSKLRKLTGLWINRKNGKTYFSGKTEDGITYLIFKNDFKEKENQPDYVLYVDDSQAEDVPF